MNEVGITGGIGSGKSTVARIFESLGFLVYYADDRAKAVMHEDEQVVSAVKAAFGTDIYTADGNLDRKALAQIVFNDPEQLKILNGIVHPATRRDFHAWIAQLPADYAKPFILKEAAILFESGAYQDMEAVISVYAPKNERIRRVTARDNTTPEQVEARMANQWPENKKMQQATYIIYNDGEHPIIPQVVKAAEFFTQKFSPQA